jgi:hypothetical protein
MVIVVIGSMVIVSVQFPGSSYSFKSSTHLVLKSPRLERTTGRICPQVKMKVMPRLSRCLNILKGVSRDPLLLKFVHDSPQLRNRNRNGV